MVSVATNELHGQHVNVWVWLCANKTLLTGKGGRLQAKVSQLLT